MAAKTHMPVSDALKPSSTQKSNLLDATAQPRRDSSPAARPSRLLSFLHAVYCAFMLYSSVTAIWDSHGDPSTVFFVLSSLSILALLYWSMREFERAVVVKDDRKRENSKRRGLRRFSLPQAIRLGIVSFGYRPSIVNAMTFDLWPHDSRSSLSPSTWLSDTVPVISFLLSLLSILGLLYQIRRLERIMAEHRRNMKITFMVLCTVYAYLCSAQARA